MKLKKFSEEVLYCDEKIVKVGYKDIELFKKVANNNERKRIRLCAHKNINDKQHEMFIIHKKGAYVRPHKHINKCESFHLIEGEMCVFLFTQEGRVEEIIRVSEYRNKNIFFCRIPEDVYHSVIIISDFVVFHETTPGPFKRKGSIFPLWAPEEGDSIAVKRFLNGLWNKVAHEFAVNKPIEI